MTQTSVQTGDLARLLETERRLGERLRAARADAEALVSQAQTAAAQREAALATELVAHERQTDERLGREQRTRERDIADDAQRQIEAYEQIPAARLAEVAKSLARRLLEEDDTP